MTLKKKEKWKMGKKKIIICGWEHVPWQLVNVLRFNIMLDLGSREWPHQLWEKKSPGHMAMEYGEQMDRVGMEEIPLWTFLASYRHEDKLSTEQDQVTGNRDEQRF